MPIYLLPRALCEHCAEQVMNLAFELCAPHQASMTPAAVVTSAPDSETSTWPRLVEDQHAHSRVFLKLL